MALTDYDFTLTRNEIIERALRIIGGLSLGESVTAEQQDQGVKSLNAMVKSWQNQHVFLWTLKTHTLSLVVADVDYSLAALDPPVVWIDRAFIVIDGQDVQLRQINFNDYQAIPDKTDSGVPVEFALDGNAATPTLYFYPAPNDTNTIKIHAITRLKDWNTASGNADFPVQWIEALTWGLAYKLAPEYGIAERERTGWERSAMREFRLAKQNDRGRADEEFVRGAY